MSKCKLYAFRCSACNCELHNFRHSSLLPDGCEEDLCPRCKAAIRYSDNTRYTDYQHEHLTEDYILTDIKTSSLFD